MIRVIIILITTTTTTTTTNNNNNDLPGGALHAQSRYQDYPC